ncbi:MAG: NAD(P)/FAD-dependent oxidoreductase [Planctomycetales bacterium]|nr:NAD(P)/FAD-dependent oxidoreductase [Planctomycetales bacterium]
MSKRHIIIGGGPAATNACETIRQFESDSEITLICNEPAHSRMALPYWLSGQIPREQTHTGDDDYFNRLNVKPMIGVTVAGIDASGKSVSLSDGTSLSFDTLLLATGSAPIGLPMPGSDLPGVQTLWTLADTEKALAAVDGHAKPRVTLVGAGFIGCIVLNAMFKRGWDLTVVERDQHMLPRMLNADAAQYVHRWVTDRGIKLHCGTRLQEITAADDGAKTLKLDNGKSVTADLVIIATGVGPNIQLAVDAGIETDNGILVDKTMQTSVPGIYAAGDVAQGPAMLETERQVHAIQPTAVDHGRVAGANMAGQSTQYNGSLLMNVLDVCGLQCASFGKWEDSAADAMTMSNENSSIYRNLLWTDDKITGAIFVGRANDLGMLTDVGMVKGFIQTQTAVGSWKEYLRENPFDVRRAFIATKVPETLAKTTLLGRPAVSRGFHFGNPPNKHTASSSHGVYVNTKEPT